MNNIIFAGVDPGITGAIVHLSPEGKLLYWSKIPVKKTAKGKTVLDNPKVARMLPELGDVRVTIERVGAMPGEGAVGAFTFGRSLGVVEGVIAARGFTARLVQPRMWQAEMFKGLPKGKQTKTSAVAMALKLWPELKDALKFKKDWDIADAALIAEFGRRKLFLGK